MLKLPHISAGVDYAGLIYGYCNYRTALAKTIRPYRYTVCYGCGNEFLAISHAWKKVSERPIDFCCDRNSAKWGKTFNGIPCRSPEELISKGEDCAVFITTGDVAGAAHFLLHSGVSNLFLFNKFALQDEALLAAWSCEELYNRTGALYDILTDHFSARVLDALLQRIFAGVVKYDLMLNVCSPDQYFPADIILPGDHEVLVDAGAFNGDSIRAFLRKTGGFFDHIYAFELDSSNFDALNTTVAALPGREKISLFNLGLWDANGEIRFRPDGPATAIDNTSGEIGRVIKLDELLENEKVTIIKMDVEGAEQNALRGAEGVILKQRPLLAVSIYHKAPDIWDIPHYLKRLLGNCRIHFRHHTGLFYDTICYATATEG